MQKTKRPRSIVKRVVAVVATLVLLVIATPIVLMAVAGPAMRDMLTPKFANTTSRLAKAEKLRPWVLPHDSTITPQRAGEALVSLAYRNGRRDSVVVQPQLKFPPLPSINDSLFADMPGGGWTGPHPVKILARAHAGVNARERAYLAELAANPLWKEYSLLARAPRMDLAGALYVLPFPRDLNSFELPILPFAGTKELAYANASRAAWYMTEKRYADAERVLRETISVGLRLADDGTMLIEQLIAVVIAGIGREQLAEFYRLTDATSASRLAAAVADTLGLAASTVSMKTRAGLIAAVTDSTLPRGLRYDLVATGALTTCTHTSELLFGASRPLRDAMQTARPGLARTPGEGAVFDLAAQLVTGETPAPPSFKDRGTAMKMLQWSARVSSAVLFNPRIAYCASMLGTDF